MHTNSNTFILYHDCDFSDYTDFANFSDLEVWENRDIMPEAIPSCQTQIIYNYNCELEIEQTSYHSDFPIL